MHWLMTANALLLCLPKSLVEAEDLRPPVLCAWVLVRRSQSCWSQQVRHAVHEPGDKPRHAACKRCSRSAAKHHPPILYEEWPVGI